MKARSVARITLAVLWAALLALYIMAKSHFFEQYEPSRVGAYVQEHSVYWVAMAAVVFLLWLIEKRFPENGP